MLVLRYSRATPVRSAFSNEPRAHLVLHNLKRWMMAPVKDPHCNVKQLQRQKLPVDTIGLARYLIGKTLVHELPGRRLCGRIVETEGYPPGDAAGHAFRGMTQRNHSLFLGPGFCYVYSTYGSSFMVNVTSEEPGVGAGVLLRALEPIEGIELMQRNRETTGTRDIARGPGRLAQAMQIDKRYDGVDLCSGKDLWLGTQTRRVDPICSSARIGLTREVHRKLRFFETGNPYVSGPKSLSILCEGWKSCGMRFLGSEKFRPIYQLIGSTHLARTGQGLNGSPKYCVSRKTFHS